jgi:hypothetical protein
LDATLLLQLKPVRAWLTSKVVTAAVLMRQKSRRAAARAWSGTRAAGSLPSVRCNLTASRRCSAVCCSAVVSRQPASLIADVDSVSI